MDFSSIFASCLSPNLVISYQICLQREEEQEEEEGIDRGKCSLAQHTPSEVSAAYKNAHAVTTVRTQAADRTLQTWAYPSNRYTHRSPPVGSPHTSHTAPASLAQLLLLHLQAAASEGLIATASSSQRGADHTCRLRLYL